MVFVVVFGVSCCHVYIWTCCHKCPKPIQLPQCEGLYSFAYEACWPNATNCGFGSCVQIDSPNGMFSNASCCSSSATTCASAGRRRVVSTSLEHDLLNRVTTRPDLLANSPELLPQVSDLLVLEHE